MPTPYQPRPARLLLRVEDVSVLTWKLTNDAVRRLLLELQAVKLALRAELGRDPLDEELADFLIATLFHQRLDGDMAAMGAEITADNEPDR